jgi:hypothetical protein
MTSARGRKGRTRPRRLASRARLDKLVEEAIIDCYDESEQARGLYTMIEDNLALPFETFVLGVRVIVERVRLTRRDQIIAVCRRRGVRQAIPLSDLPLPSPAPAGSEWIDAYRYWLDAR